MDTPTLFRARDDRVLAGVCAGLAEHLGVPVMPVRIGMVVCALLGGAGAVFYLWLWATAPLAGESEGVVPLRRALSRPAAPDTPADNLPGGSIQWSRWPIAEILLGTCLLIAGGALVLAQFGVQIRLEVILPALAVLVGVGLTWWQVADRNRPERHQMPRVLGALSLVAVGVLTFFVTANQPNAWTVIAAAVAVLLGVALALAPWLLRINRELSAERAARAREAERSDIAAHLHDSVLQTLAMIQQRSAPGSEVARLARAQERELREWLFRTADGAEAAPRQALGSALTEHGADLESRYEVRFEIVIVGGQGTGAEGVEAPEPIVLAAREAMLNAAQHAGGAVSVYAEITPERVLIDVLDRGPGLDADTLPEGRMGVREAIIGRMERSGGAVSIGSGPGGRGTSVQLAMPRDTETAEQSTALRGKRDE